MILDSLVFVFVKMVQLEVTEALKVLMSLKRALLVQASVTELVTFWKLLMP